MIYLIFELKNKQISHLKWTDPERIFTKCNRFDTPGQTPSDTPSDTKFI
jgi:hypothetical protein